MEGLHAQSNKSKFNLKKNNFDVIRFLAAIMVVWFHSFPLTGTSNGEEFFIRISQSQTAAGALGVFVFFVISGFLITALGIEHFYYYIYFGLYFFAGMIFYLWKDQIQLNGKLALVAIGILVLGVYTQPLTLALSVGGTYLIFYLSLGPVPKFPKFSKYGDLSYGIYIYSFVVQQVLQLVTHNGLTQMQNFLYTLPIVFICAFISWHLVEKKCMQLKNKTLFRMKREEGLKK